MLLRSEGEKRRRGERSVGATLSSRERASAGRERPAQGVEVNRAVATGAGEDDRDHFAGNPLPLSFSFYSSPFLISFSIFDLNTAVKELFGVPKQHCDELGNLISFPTI